MTEFVHRFSLFNGARDPMPTRLKMTWSRFVAEMLPHGFRHEDDKLSCLAFSPAFYPEHTPRGKKNAISASMWAGDLDGGTDDELELIVDKCLELGWTLLVYSTWSNARKPGNSVRYVVPLSREVTPEEWPTLWHAMNGALGELSDPSCKDISRIYFGAFAPNGDEEAAFSHVWDAAPADVDAVLAAAPKIKAKPAKASKAPRVATTTKEKVSRARLLRFGKMLSRKTDARKSEIGAQLVKACGGESFAAAGSRDNTIYRISLELAKYFTECDAMSIAEHFGTSLVLMAKEADECPTVDDVAYKIERAQEELLAERAATEATEAEQLARRIKDAFANGRTTPYTHDEIPADTRWIVQKGTSYYTWVAGEYRGPYTKEEAQNAIVRDLSPAVSVGVDLFTIDKQGRVAPKMLSTLVRSYGFIANDVAVSLSAQRSHFNESTRTIVEAPCPLREIEPKHHTEIAAWLAALAGAERITLLLAWLANITKLDKPCTALFLTGPKSAGKGLLPEGLSRLWTLLGFPTPLQDVLATSFNDAQLKCPLTFADERLPTDFRGRVLNAELREFIQSRSRPLRRKFQSHANMVGCTRLVISANNEEVLATPGDMSNHDIEASIDRYLWIPCQEQAAEVLASVEHSKWVESDAIAAHALWLRDNFEWKPNGRFLVHSNDRELHSRLMSSSGVRTSVLQFCVGFLLDPNPLMANAKGQFLIRVNKGRLCVNTQALVACWETYVKNAKCPDTGRLAGAIAALSSDERPRLTIPNTDKRPNYRVIGTEHLKAWAHRTNFASDDEIDEALEHDTEKRTPHLKKVAAI